MFRRNFFYGLLRGAVTACVAMTGCTPADPLLVPISGQVLLEGQPVADVIVTFTPIGSTAGSGSLGGTSADGKFTLTDVRGGRGGHVGAYRVSLYPAPPVAGRDLPSDTVSSGRADVPELLRNPNRSPLRATVPPAGAEIEIQLTRTGTGSQVVTSAPAGPGK